MKIVYAASCVSQAAYERLYGGAKAMPAFQAQKYHRLFIEGLAAHTHVDVIGCPDAESSVLSSRVVKLPQETVGNATYRYIWGFRGPFRRVHVFFSTFFHCLRLLGGDSAVIIDCLNQMSGLAGLLAARLRGKHCVGIVTDIPQFFSNGQPLGLAKFLMRHCTDYVFLTEAMNELLNQKGRPHVVLEGHADAAMERCLPSLDRKAKKRVCLYAGRIDLIYGIQRLVEGFRLADLPDTELRIYGSGDFQEELEKISAETPNVFYGGLLLPSQVVEKEMEATLLVNPRPSNEKYVRYSFPSKTMEYMSTGTPVLMTKLPCLPEEYLPYLLFIRDETPQGIAQALRETLRLSDEALFQQGCAARRFVLEQRSNVMQAAKVLEMLERNRKK